jgi:hypothetical protein
VKDKSVPSGVTATLNLVGFVRFLRQAGLGTAPGTTSLLVEATEAVGFHSRADVRAAFRALIVTDRTHNRVFDESFDAFFRGEVLYQLDDVYDRAATVRQEPTSAEIGISRSASGEADEVHLLDTVEGSSPAERLMDVDFSELTPHEADQVAEILDSMQWSPSTTRSRRWKPSVGGPRPDMRRTLRRAASPEGDLLPLRFVERTVRQRPLVVIADISGSMERYTRMLLHFLHGAQHRFGRVETFVFATRLTRVTRELRRRNPTDAIAMVTEAVEDWSGGTRIGESLRTYNRWWSRRVSSRGPIGLIISDGWETGDPELLGLEMERFARSVHSVIWLNPLAGRQGFEPIAAGMASAMPHIDDLLAAGTANNLKEVVGLLDMTAGRRSRAAS